MIWMQIFSRIRDTKITATPHDRGLVLIITRKGPMDQMIIHDDPLKICALITITAIHLTLTDVPSIMCVRYATCRRTASNKINRLVGKLTKNYFSKTHVFSTPTTLVHILHPPPQDHNITLIMLDVRPLKITNPLKISDPLETPGLLKIQGLIFRTVTLITGLKAIDFRMHTPRNL